MKKKNKRKNIPLSFLEIRIWDDYNKQMLEVFSIIWNNKTGKFRISAHKLGVKNILKEGWFIIKERDKKYITVMRYIGKKDKNNKKIFEYDIVEWIPKRVKEMKYKLIKSGLGVVKWDENICGFYIEQIRPLVLEREWGKTEVNFYDYMGRVFDWNELKVVGNIFENKELLKNEKKKIK